MYYEHFGLDEAPFKITPNTDFFFSGGNRGPVLEALIYAITHGEGIVKVTGEVGSGKTMLCNMLQNRLPEEVERVYLANPNVAPEDVLHAIAFELQLGVPTSADRLELIHVLQDHLVTRHAEGKRVVVFIEESQSMPLATLEEIRLLSNLETRTDKLLQIVLFGQPELDHTLRRPDIRQLRDRIAHSFRLEPLSHADVREYLMFRMRAAGYRGPEIFSPAVVAQIARASSGLTRRINLIADKALLAAFSENTHTIEARHVRDALRDSEFGQAIRDPSRLWDLPSFAWAAMALVAGTALGAGAYALLVGGSEPTPSKVADPKVYSAIAALAAARAASVNTPVLNERSSATNGPMRADTVSTERNTTTSGPVPPAPPTANQTLAMAASSPLGGPGASSELPAQPTRQHAATLADGIIAERIAATHKWLSSNPNAAFSIQLGVATDEKQLRQNLKNIGKFIEINDIYMYRSVTRRRPAVHVLWGAFADRGSADKQLEELPQSLRASRPFVRTLSAIRADIDHYGAVASR